MLANAPCQPHEWRHVNPVRQQAGSYGSVPGAGIYLTEAPAGRDADCVPDTEPTGGAGLLAKAPCQPRRWRLVNRGRQQAIKILFWLNRLRIFELEDTRHFGGVPGGGGDAVGRTGESAKAFDAFEEPGAR